jgi:hypothetical protein
MNPMVRTLGKLGIFIVSPSWCSLWAVVIGPAILQLLTPRNYYG